MKKEDFRTIGNEARAVIRPRAVALVVSRGQSRQEAADILGVSRQTVSGWLQRYEASGQPGLDDGRRNEHRRDSGILTAAEARKVQAWILGRCPDQMRLPFALWTAPAVRGLLRREFGEALGVHAAKTPEARHAARPAEDQGVAEAGISAHRPARQA